MQPLPPIPSNIFLHYLSHTDDHRRLLWYNRIPKKLYNSILQTDDADGDSLVVGWGVHIIEGLHRFNLFATMLAVLALSAFVSVMWATVGMRGDVQGAFGIGSFLVGIQTAILMMILARWNEV